MIEYERPKYDNVIITDSNKMSEEYQLDDGTNFVLANKAYSWVWDIPNEYFNVDYIKNIQNIEWNIIYRPDVVESLIKQEGGERVVIPYVEYKTGNGGYTYKVFQIRRDWEIQDIRYGNKQLVQVYGRFASMDITGKCWKNISW